MRPVLFQWRGIAVRSYPAMLFVGLTLGVVAGNMAAHAAGINAVRVYVATLILVVPALAGARLLFVAAEWQTYRHNLRRVWDRNDGGYIMYGGLPLALLASVPLLRALGLGLGDFWDTAIFAILVGMFFTRIGCLLNGCCSGRPSNGWFSFNLPNERGAWEKRVPTQALEALWAAVLLVSAVLARRFLVIPGSLFLMVAFGYACGRLLMESARERRQSAFRFSIAHIVSLVIALVSISSLIIHWRK